MAEDTTRRRRVIDEGVEGRTRRVKDLSVSGRKNRVVARMKAGSLNPKRNNQSTDSNQ